jgi:hypothetical protein
MYQKTLGLGDNPFNPQFPSLKLIDLAGSPLPLDRHYDALEPLFDRQIANIGESDDVICDLLFGVKPSEASQGNIVKRQIIFIFRGGRGTGKTTLSFYVKKLVEANVSPLQDKWHTKTQSFSANEDPPDIGAFRNKIDALHNEIIKDSGNDERSLFILLDNVPPRGFPRIVDLYEGCIQHFRVFVVTTTDKDLKQEHLDSFQPLIRLIDTHNLDIKDVSTYVQDRVTHFRYPKRQEITQTSKLFPFATTAPQRLLGGPEGPSQPLRVLNRVLSREVEAHHTRLLRERPSIDVGTIPMTDLSKLLIP